MKTTITIFTFLFLFIGLSQGQMIKKPIEDKVTNETIPTDIEENHSWVKGHWEWIDNEYQWIDGAIVENKENHMWIDGEWERNNTTGAWFYSEGYWEPSDQSATISGAVINTNASKTDGESEEAISTSASFGSMFGK